GVLVVVHQQHAFDVKTSVPGCLRDRARAGASVGSKERESSGHGRKLALVAGPAVLRPHTQDNVYVCAMKHRLLEALRDLIPTARSTLFSVLAIAIAVATTLSVHGATESVRDVLRDERRPVAAAGAIAVESRMDATMRTVEAVFSGFAPWNDQVAAPAPSRLDALLDVDLGLLDAFILNASSVVAVPSTRSLESLGFPRSGPNVTRAFSGEVVVSSVQRDRTSNRDVLMLLMPIATSDGSIGAVGVAVLPVADGPLNAVVGLLQEASGDAPRAQVGVILPSGSVITSSGLGTSTDDLWIAAAAAPPTAPGIVTLVDHEAVGGDLLVATVTTSRGWRVAVSELRSLTEPNLIDERAVVAALPGLLALLGLLSWLGVTRRRQIRHLAEDAEVTKRAFLAVTGHELRTPLTVLGGMLKTMTMALTRDSVQPEMLATMVDASRRNAQLLELRIERILLVAALEAGAGATVQNRSTPLERLADDLVQTVAQTAPTHTITATIEPGLTLHADPKAVSQVLLELLNNAVRYTPSGGEIHLEARKRGRRAQIAVRDNGVGLPSNASHLFEKFRQGEEVNQRVHDEGGVGLGLFIVRTLVDAMGGHVRIERGDPGTRVMVELTAL
ncbi:MAG: signal transduction histidine kinase, partial [Glaciecola sp.]